MGMEPADHLGFLRQLQLVNGRFDPLPYKREASSENRIGGVPGKVSGAPTVKLR